MREPPAARRLPAQARSQARFDAVLAAAAGLIGERGLDPVTMTDVAERAGMSVTALYRYFPNKASVVRELALRTFAHDTETLLTGELPDDVGVAEVVAAGVEEFRRRHAEEPFRLQLRAAIHADAELSARSSAGATPPPSQRPWRPCCSEMTSPSWSGRRCWSSRPSTA